MKIAFVLSNMILSVEVMELNIPMIALPGVPELRNGKKDRVIKKDQRTNIFSARVVVDNAFVIGFYDYFPEKQ